MAKENRKLKIRDKHAPPGGLFCCAASTNVQRNLGLISLDIHGRGRMFRLHNRVEQDPAGNIFMRSQRLFLLSMGSQQRKLNG
jgi:hypothetical protein